MTTLDKTVVDESFKKAIQEMNEVRKGYDEKISSFEKRVTDLKKNLIFQKKITKKS